MSSSPFGALNCCLLSPHGCRFAVGSEFFNLLMFHLHVLYPYLEDSFGLTINQFIVHPHVPGRLSLIRQVNSFKGGLDPNLSPADDSAGGPGGGPGAGQGGTRELPRCFFQFLHNLLTTVKVTANKEDPRGKR